MADPIRMSKITDANNLKEEIIKDLTDGQKSRKDTSALRKHKTTESSGKMIKEAGSGAMYQKSRTQMEERNGPRNQNTSSLLVDKGIGARKARKNQPDNIYQKTNKKAKRSDHRKVGPKAGTIGTTSSMTAQDVCNLVHRNSSKPPSGRLSTGVLTQVHNTLTQGG